MDNILKDKVVFVCLAENFGQSLVKELADNLGLYFLSIKDLVEYDLFNSKEVLSKCGEEYYLKREKDVCEMACSYENSFMFANFDLFSHNYKTFLNNATVIFLKVPQKKLSQKDVISKLNFASREDFLKRHSNLVAEIKSSTLKAALDEIINFLGALYENN